MLTKYIRNVQYHETDRMGITHHSNYVKWMEEAKVDFLSKIGYTYNQMETDGVSAPVIELECQYLAPTTFGDIIEINASVLEFDGVTVTINYVMVNSETQKTVFTGKTKHCFVDKTGKLIILKKVVPEMAKRLKQYAAMED